MTATLPATLELHVDVTQDHIDHGIQENCQECPIALAVTAALQSLGYDDSVNVEANDTDVEVTEVKTGCQLIADLPLHAQEFISAFDCGLEVSPFGLDLVFAPCACGACES